MRVVSSGSSSSNPFLGELGVRRHGVLGGMGNLTQELEALVQQPHTTRSAAKAAKESASTKGRGASKRASKSKGARPRRGEHVSKEEAVRRARRWQQQQQQQ
eukprot:1156326-Pelagomonas_calceolata.AAC.10